jgi:ArsR family metal-binding transcriptional regulator
MEEINFDDVYDDIEIDSSEFRVGQNNELLSKENIDETGLSHLDKIKLAGSASEIELRDPKKNCSKCGGRGYTGFRSVRGMPFGTGQPIVCKCMFVKDDKATVAEQREALHGGGIIRPKLNREQRRKMQKRIGKKR